MVKISIYYLCSLSHHQLKTRFLKKEELDFLSQEYHHVDTQKFRINEGIKVSPENVGGVIVVD